MKIYTIEKYNCDDHIAIVAYKVDPLLNKKYRLPRPLSSYRSNIFDIYTLDSRYDLYESNFIERLLGFSLEKRLKIAMNSCRKWVEEQERQENKFKYLCEK